MTTQAPLGAVQYNMESISHSGEPGNFESIALSSDTENLNSIPLPRDPENLESTSLSDKSDQKSNPLSCDPTKGLDTKSSFGSTLISGEENLERKNIYNEDTQEAKSASERTRNTFLSRPWSRPSMNFSSRSYTLPANTGSNNECKVLDIDNLPKLSKWDTFKNKIYLSPAFGGTRRMTTMKESKCYSARADLACSSTQEHDYSTIEGLDLGGLPPMSNKSRKLFSWSKFMHGVRGKKGKDYVLDSKNEEDSEATEKVEKKFSMAWFQKKFLQGRGSGADGGFGNGEISKKAEEEVKCVSADDTNYPTIDEVL